MQATAATIHQGGALQLLIAITAQRCAAHTVLTGAAQQMPTVIIATELKLFHALTALLQVAVILTTVRAVELQRGNVMEMQTAHAL